MTSARHDMQQNLAHGHTATEQRRKQHDGIVLRSRAVQQVKAQPNADGHKPDPLQQAQRAGEFIEFQLVDIGQHQHQTDGQHTKSVEVA